MKKIIYGMFAVLCTMSCANALDVGVVSPGCDAEEPLLFDGMLSSPNLIPSSSPELPIEDEGQLAAQRPVEPVWMNSNKTSVVFNRDVITPADFSIINELDLSSGINYIIIKGKLADDACPDLLRLGARYNGVLNITIINTEVAPQFIATLNELASRRNERLYIEFCSCKNVTEDQRATLEANGAIVRTY